VLVARGSLVLAGAAALLLASGRADPTILERIAGRLFGATPGLDASFELDALDASLRVVVVRGVVLAAFAAALAHGLTTRARRARARRLATIALGAVVELTLTARSATPLADRSVHLSRPALSLGFRAEGSAPPRFHRASDERVPRRFERGFAAETGPSFRDFERDGLRGRVATLHGLDQLHDDDPHRTPLASRLAEAIELLPPARRARLLAALGCELVASDEPLDLPLVVATAPPLVHRLQRIPDALPRYRVVTTAERLPSHHAALERLSSGTFARGSVLLRADGVSSEPEDREPFTTVGVPGASDSSPDPGSAGVRVVSIAPDRVELELDGVEAPSFLVARDAFDPAWGATVDGAPARVLRADFAFRAVEIPRGARQVVLAYDGSLARRGLAIQSVGWLLVLLVCCWPGRVRRPARPSIG